MLSPIEIAGELKDKPQFFDKKMLNPSANVENYQTKTSKALNLGVYTADLGFIIVMQQTQNVEEYLGNINNLIQKLGLENKNTDSLMNLVENNITNTDSLIKFSTQAFFSADAFMKENDKLDISIISMNGAWIESLYLLSEIIKQSPNDSILTKLLADQSFAAKNIYKLDSIYIPENKKIINAVIGLQPYFNSCLEIKKIEKYDEFDDTTRLKTIVNYKCEKENLDKLIEKISEIRKNFITLQ